MYAEDFILNGCTSENVYDESLAAHLVNDLVVTAGITTPKINVDFSSIIIEKKQELLQS